MYLICMCTCVGSTVMDINFIILVCLHPSSHVHVCICIELVCILDVDAPTYRTCGCLFVEGESALSLAALGNINSNSTWGSALFHEGSGS